MTAPEKSPMLPPCPLCNAAPVAGWDHAVGESPRYTVRCYGGHHEVSVSHRTKRTAIAEWRRRAGGGAK